MKSINEIGIAAHIGLERPSTCDLHLPALETSMGIHVPTKPLTLAEAIERDDVIVKDKAGKVITKELFEKMKDYTALLRKKFPTMKQARVQRKVQEHFKIKL